MCLDTVDKKPTVTEGVGWRVVRAKNRGLYPAFQDGRLRMGRWLTDCNEETIFVGPGLRYKAGFHLFPDKDDAETMVSALSGIRDGCSVRRVAYRTVVATGCQYFCDHQCRVIVAREIYIHPK